MFVVDTNLLLYAAVEQFHEHDRALELVSQWRDDVLPWHLTWGIAYEFLRVSTHPAVFQPPLSFPAAWSFLAAVTTGPGFSFLLPTARHALIVADLATELPSVRGNIMHDVHTAALMREHGIAEIRTADTDFHVFPFVRVVNPLV
ncbi:MAG: PIN domain-containing protein [Gemmatimonadetes bacterium]|nr:PIN domain-containing protein [Gemmatimonadota bacterium]